MFDGHLTQLESNWELSLLEEHWELKLIRNNYACSEFTLIVALTKYLLESLQLENWDSQLDHKHGY